MRDELVGYLLGALDAPDARRVEAALAEPRDGEALRRDAERLRLALRPLTRDRDVLAPPRGLAQRTMARIRNAAAMEAGEAARQPRIFSPAESPAPVTGSRAWLDRLIIAATAVAAAVLVVPLTLDSIAESRSRRAERNLQKLAGGLQGYAESHRVYPTPPDAGPLSRAGLYAPTLVSEHRIVADDGTVLVPGTSLSRDKQFRVPTLEELKAAVGTPRFEQLIQQMGGDFGYTLGHRDAAGVLQPNENRRRAHHPIMADAPDPCCQKSSNHPGGIHYILYEDGRVERIFQDDLHRDDHLYQNEDGKTAAADDPDDAVIGDSHHQP